MEEGELADQKAADVQKAEEKSMEFRLSQARLIKERVEAAAAVEEAAAVLNSTILRSDTGDALIDGACTRDTIPQC